MLVKRWGLTLGALAIAASPAWTLAATPPQSADTAGADSITLTGCLVRGDAGGYLLTNGPNEPAWQKAGTSVTPGAVGTAGTVAPVFYWLRDDDQLRDHVGHRVDVEGVPEHIIADGEIKVDRKRRWTEIEITSDGDSLKARVPHLAVAPVGDGERTAPVLVRRIDVERLRMISASCQP